MPYISLRSASANVLGVIFPATLSVLSLLYFPWILPESNGRMFSNCVFCGNNISFVLLDAMAVVPGSAGNQGNQAIEVLGWGAASSGTGLGMKARGEWQSLRGRELLG